MITSNSINANPNGAIHVKTVKVSAEFVRAAFQMARYLHEEEEDFDCRKDDTERANHIYNSVRAVWDETENNETGRIIAIELDDEVERMRAKRAGGDC